MYDTYMSEEEFNNLSEGDEITVRKLEDLTHDFGENINVFCGWSTDMDELCERTLVVDYIERGVGIIRAKGQDWAFCREMLEPKEGAQTISQEEVSQLWENMILGGNDDKKR